jgi:Xaa-Pro aminopeptidase
METADRLNRFKERLRRGHLDGFLVTNRKNIYYLSGFTGSNGYLLVLAEGDAYLSTDFRYEEQAGLQAASYQLLIQKGVPYAELNAAICSGGIHRIGIDASHMTLEGYEVLKNSLGSSLEYVAAQDPCYVLRQIKDPDELALMRLCMRITDDTLCHMKDYIQAGMTEKAVAMELEATIKNLGAEALAFDTIVAAGKRSSLPHGQPTDYVLAAGDFVTLDFGCLVSGYPSDQTRTFIMGRPSEEQRRVYQLVLDAQEAAIQAIAPGKSTVGIDRIARDMITQGGYGDYFGHGLGHSLGLSVHEDPRFSQRSKDQSLMPHMVITVEPGIYVPGWGGVRIEDVIIVTESGCENITTSPKSLEAMCLTVP